MHNIFLELIQVAVGTRKKLSRIPSEGDWQLIYETAVKQSLVGIVFSAIEILNKQDSNIKPPMPLFYNWLAEVKRIEQQNKNLNEAAATVYSIFKSNGLRSCVLKGQGVARLYDVRCKKSDVRSKNYSDVGQRAKNLEQSSRVQEFKSLTETSETFENFRTNTETTDGVSLSLRRQPGDIDIWVEGGREKVLSFLKEKQLKIGKIVIHHVDVSIIDDVETEVHFLPSYTYDYLRYIKYKRFFKKKANQQFENFDEQVGFAYPTLRFNAVYLMIHIFRHVFHEGIGLRQLMDYYFVMKNEELKDKSEKLKVMETLQSMGLMRFTEAVMYVMKVVFLMDDRYLLCMPSKEMGEFLLEEIFQGGNFGKFGEQYKEVHSGGRLYKYLMNIKRLKKVYSLCPSEVLWAPVWKPSHWLWRKWKGYV